MKTNTQKSTMLFGGPVIVTEPAVLTPRRWCVPLPAPTIDDPIIPPEQPDQLSIDRAVEIGLQLAHQGEHMRTAYITQAMCTPSRQSITGRQ